MRTDLGRTDSAVESSVPEASAVAVARETSGALAFQPSSLGGKRGKMEFQVGKGDASKDVEKRKYLPFRAESSNNYNGKRSLESDYAAFNMLCDEVYA